jgi:hypothetical protein
MIELTGSLATPRSCHPLAPRRLKDGGDDVPTPLIASPAYRVKAAGAGSGRFMAPPFHAGQDFPKIRSTTQQPLT